MSITPFSDPLRMAEAIPTGHKECRLVQERGLYWLVVPHPAQYDIETPSGDGVVALDPRRSHLSHVLFRNRLRQARPPRLRARSTALPLARRPHQPHCQGTQPTKASANALGAGANAPANNQPGGRAPLATGSLVDQQLPDHPATNFRDPGHDPKGWPERSAARPPA